MKRLVASIIVLVSTALALCAQVPRTPTIKITFVPAYDPAGGPDKMQTIEGTSNGCSPKDCRVVLFSLTNRWYVQPTAASPRTFIGDDGTWRAQIHLGAEYAALLVRPAYRPPATTDALPETGGDILAIDVKPGKK